MASEDPKDIELILIVEDSPTQALLLKESFEEHKLEVMVAKDGIEALQAMQKRMPTVVISDIDMPRMNGYEFCQRVKQDNKFKDIPVILLTNLTDTMDAIKGIECGADSFLTKPCEIDTLLTTMRDVLNNRQAYKELTSDQKIEFFFRGKKHELYVDQVQVTDLLLSTYATAIQKNMELGKAFRKLNLIHEELERKNVQLEQLNKEKNQFLGMAAHDLRNPLAIIQGYSQMLLEKLSQTQDGKTILMLESIKRSSSYMLALINDLLDVSVIESGTVNLHLSSFNLVSFVDEILALVNKQATDKKISIEKREDCAEVEVWADRQKIEQVLINLLTNAIKFSNPETIVQVELSSTDNDVLIAIKDQGVGIPEEEKGKLFQPFTKTSAKATAGESSTGLGLAIAKKIVEAHHGSIWADSQVGVGSTFFVSLPKWQPNTPTEGKQSQEQK